MSPARFRNTTTGPIANRAGALRVFSERTTLREHSDLRS
jgi:hypothetical protein